MGWKGTRWDAGKSVGSSSDVVVSTVGRPVIHGRP